MDDDRSPPVRIIKKKKSHGGHHGGAWKVAYADFVTAMMALFIVLWIIGQNNAIKEAIAMYFNDPGVFSDGARYGGIHSGSAPLTPPKMDVEPLKQNLGIVQSEIEKLKLESKKIEEKIASVPAFEKFKDKIQITVSRDGMKIELIEDSKGLFFDVGSAKMKEETIKLMALIASEVGKLNNKVIIEGHTDARPYITPGYSNWELSFDRGNAARKVLDTNGLRKDQVQEVRGYADRMLRLPDKPYDYANRRVNIIVAIPKMGEENTLTTVVGPNTKSDIIVK